MLLAEETMGQAQLVLGYLGFFSTLAVIAAPACTTLRDAWNEGNVGERSALPFIGAIFNAGVFLLCGLITGEMFVTWLNLAVASVQAIYLSYFTYKSTAAQRKRWLIYFASGAIVYAGVLWLYFTGRTSHFNVLCGVSGAALAFTPLLNLPAVWNSVSMQSMPPLPVPLASLINGAVLTSYAFAGTKALAALAASAICNILSAAIQILLHGCCYVLQWPELQEFEVGLLDDQEEEA